MKINKIVKVAGKAIIGYVVVDTAIGVIKLTCKGIKKLTNERKIKKGLKEGRVIIIDGEYYEVEVL